MITNEFMFCKLAVKDSDDLFEQLSSKLIERGIVKSSFCEALKKRENEYPTGLPMKYGVAIPHTDGNFVNKDQLIFATLDKPILFNEMGGLNDEKLSINVVIMLAIKEGGQHLTVLQNLISSIQQEEFVEGLINAKTVNEMEFVIRKYLNEMEEL